MEYKVIAVGDPHARLSTLPEIVDLATRLVNLIKEEQATHLVVLGDLFNDFARVHVLVMRAVSQFFEILTSAQIPVYYIVGNHDYINNQVFQEDLHALTAYRHWPYLSVIDKAVYRDGFVFCPYVPVGRFAEAVLPAIEDGGKHPTRAVFCHQEFKGAKMGAIESAHGDEWSEDMPLVVSGHIHDYCWLKPNILYVGAPMSQAFGESDDKTVSILEFENEALKSERRVSLGFPKRITVTLTVAEAKKYVIPENTKVRVNLTGTTEELTAFKKTQKFAEMSKVAKVVPKSADKVIVRQGGEKRRYLDILKQACSVESPAVRAAFDELTQTEAPNAT